MKKTCIANMEWSFRSRSRFVFGRFCLLCEQHVVKRLKRISMHEKRGKFDSSVSKKLPFLINTNTQV